MDNEFKACLTTVAQGIDKLIREDPFPDAVQPECLRSAVRNYPCRGGKRLRPALLTWSCGLFGGNPESARFAAAAVEIYHNWTLVHDDIIDQDDFRRGLPTCHRVLAAHGKDAISLSPGESSQYGIDMAILAGDIQQAWAVNTLLRSTESGVSAALTLALVQRLQQKVNCELISGEALDVELSHRPLEHVTEKDVEAIHIRKTGALLRFCAECGAAIALENFHFEDMPIRQAGDFAEWVGLAFQLRDDYLGLFGDADKFGKPIGSDLSGKKPTLLMVKTLQNLSGSGKTELLEMLGKSTYTQEEITRVRILMRSSSAVDLVENQAADYARKAREILMTFPDNLYRKHLEDMMDYLAGRQI